MRKFGRREGAQTKTKSKLRHGLMSVVIFDHQEVTTKAKAFVTSIANAAISLANWSTNEENVAIHDTCTKMYELSMLLSSAINLFSKEYSVMGNSLKELLRQEMNLDDLNKRVYQAEVKAIKLKKQNTEKEKKLECLGKAELEYEELKASLDAQNTKHEILKAQCLRESFSRFADGTKSFAQRISTISEAEKEIASSIPVVPTQMGRNQEYQGEEATDEIVRRTADALNFARPISFVDILAEKRARARKAKVKSCFIPDSNESSSPERMDWVMVEQSMSASLVDISQASEYNEERGLSAEMLSCLKERLHIDNSGGRSYISNPGIEQRLAYRARGLSATDESVEPPISPPLRSPRRKVPDPLADLPRVEPYAVSRWKPNEAGLYAQADLFSSGVARLPRSWQGDEKRRDTDDSGEYTMPREFGNENDVVYAVLEQKGIDVTAEKRYLDVIQ